MVAAEGRHVSGGTVLLVAAVAVVLLAFGFGLVTLRGPGNLPVEDCAPVIPGAEADVPADETRALVGCLQATGESDVFMLAVPHAVGPPPGTRLDPAPEIPPAEGAPDIPAGEGTGVPLGEGVEPMRAMVTYRLVEIEGFDLESHVGHTVRITGGVADESPEFPRLQVLSFSHVSAECGTP